MEIVDKTNDDRPLNHVQLFRWIGFGGLGLAVVVVSVVLLPWLLGSDPDQLVTEIEQYVETQEFDRAFEGLQKLEAHRPPTPEDHLLRARVAIGQEMIDDAINELEQIPDDHPLGSFARLRAGQLFRKSDQLVPAEAQLLKAIELDPMNLTARRELIGLYSIQLRRDDVRAQFKALDAQETLSFQDLYFWTLTRRWDWDVDENVLRLERALVVNPADRLSRLALARKHLRSGRYQQAEEVLALVEEDDLQGRMLRAELALEQGETTTASRLLDEAPEELPERWVLEGRLAMLRGNLDLAVDLFQKAFDSRPGDRAVLNDLVASLKSLGRDDEAQTYLEQSRLHDKMSSVFEDASNDNEAVDLQLLLKLAGACEQVGWFAEARAWFELALLADPLNRQAQNGMIRLTTSPTP